MVYVMFNFEKIVGMNLWKLFENVKPFLSKCSKPEIKFYIKL